MSDANPSTELPDLRPQLRAAQEWVVQLARNVQTDQLGLPTPCGEYDVATLLGHLLGVQGKIVAIAEGRDPHSVPDVADRPDDFPSALEAATAEGQAAWADDALLGQTLTAPWGVMPGAHIMGGLVMEHVAHGWDLATATGQPCETTPALAETALAIARQAVPEDRDHFPFDEAVPPAPDAGPTEQLANWLGRASR